ncbi:MAG: membrane lipoprotein lipid attachment site-containing protein [Bacteroidales bacterium]|nr:membrane lipoprotein lipid attachment site-containing protein [Bacteroidales bacterium]
MKKIFTFFIAALLLAGCGSTTKKLQQGNYDAVIDKTTKKLIRKADADNAAEMDRAFRMANERDLERIKYLKMENNPDNYDEIFSKYNMLKMRQQKVRTVTPLTIDGKIYSYEYVDYDAELISAKRKAADFFYNNGKALLENALQKDDYRNAYYQLMKASEYSGGQFAQIDELIYDARMKGISRVIVEVSNQGPLKLPPQVEDDLISFDTRGLGNEWVEYHLKHVDEDAVYDYAIIVKLLSIMVSPDETKDVDEIFNKRISDGFDYVLDANGNVMKDTAGNDIKLQKFKDITCTLVETRQFKSVEIRGEIEILSMNPERLMQKEPFGASNQFEHSSARAIGDVGALTEEALKKTQQEKIQFPTDVEMVMICTETIKPAIRNAIYANRQYIK